ncbi:MAG: phytoene desaturase family protein, partial [Actinomycetes bacterium]
LKTALAWLGAQSGPPPHEVATAPLVGWLPMLHRRPPGHPRGGSGVLSDALARRLAADGGTVRCGDGAARITRGPGGRVDGVVTASGAHVRARAVLAGCHVLTTAALLDDDTFSPRVRRDARVGQGIGMAVRLDTTDLPRYPSDPGAAHRAMQLLAPSRAHLRAAYGDHLAGRQPQRPAALALTFSAFDDTLAPPGRHAVTVWGQWHPYALADGASWDDAGQRAADRLVAEVERAAPGFASAVERVHVQTPADLERELGLHGGNVMHLEMGLDAMFALRPLPGLAAYRSGVEGLYLTGASTHPGGGISGASGRSAAQTVIGDLTGGRRGRVRRTVRRTARRAVWRVAG